MWTLAATSSSWSRRRQGGESDLCLQLCSGHPRGCRVMCVSGRINPYRHPVRHLLSFDIWTPKTYRKKRQTSKEAFWIFRECVMVLVTIWLTTLSIKNQLDTSQAKLKKEVNVMYIIHLQLVQVTPYSSRCVYSYVMHVFYPGTK